MIKPFLLSVSVAGMLLLSGCGEDSSTEARLNYITMINATQNTIESNFDGDKEDIESKEPRDKLIAEVSEAPKVSYDGVGELTLAKGDTFTSYVATTCQGGTKINHTPSPGELHIVNTQADSVVVVVNDVDVNVEACSYHKVSNVKFENKTITIKMGDKSADIKDPESEEIHDTVVFEDDDIKSYEIKAIRL